MFFARLISTKLMQSLDFITERSNGERPFCFLEIGLGSWKRCSKSVKSISRSFASSSISYTSYYYFIIICTQDIQSCRNKNYVTYKYWPLSVIVHGVIVDVVQLINNFTNKPLSLILIWKWIKLFHSIGANQPLIQSVLVIIETLVKNQLLLGRKVN